MMRVTHVVFTFGLIALAAAWLGLGIAAALLAALWLAAIVNYIIDAAGHETRNGRRRRTAATHSLTGATAVGAVAGFAPTLAVLLAAPGAVGVYYGSLLLLEMTALGAAAGLSHLLLDALTEGGIYYRGHRWALAHWHYDNGAANGLFALLGILMFAAAFLLMA
ncbi:MAG: DUF1286 domain-containing protein [Nitrososphaeria archaeon]